MPIPLEEMEAGYYIARVKDVPDSEFPAVVWGTPPFLQCWELSSDLTERPTFRDAKPSECEFLVRLASAKEVATAMAASQPATEPVTEQPTEPANP